MCFISDDSSWLHGYRNICLVSGGFLFVADLNWDKRQSSLLVEVWQFCVDYVCELLWECVRLCYLSVLHYNQPSLVEDRDSFCTAMSHNSTGLVLNQHSEWTLFSVTHILLMSEHRKRKTLGDDGAMKLNEASVQFSLELFLELSYLDQDILAEAREGVFEVIKSDVMPLPHRAAHTIAHFLCATPLPVLAHTVNERAC